jgi:hypothetical protein
VLIGSSLRLIVKYGSVEFCSQVYNRLKVLMLRGE